MQTCTEIESRRAELMWDFFRTVYYEHVAYWSDKLRWVGFGYVNDSCE